MVHCQAILLQEKMQTPVANPADRHCFPLGIMLGHCSLLTGYGGRGGRTGSLKKDGPNVFQGVY